MKTLPLSDAKAKLSRVVDDVARRDERITITRNGTPAAVILSAEDYESLNATIEILSDPEFAAAVRRGLNSLNQGKGHTLEQVFGRTK
jgi:prevent-host-death family protein